MSSLLRFIDRLTERGVRQVAHRHGRRSLLTRLGVLIAGGLVCSTRLQSKLVAYRFIEAFCCAMFS